MFTKNWSVGWTGAPPLVPVLVPPVVPPPPPLMAEQETSQRPPPTMNALLPGETASAIPPMRTTAGTWAIVQVSPAG